MASRESLRTRSRWTLVLGLRGVKEALILTSFMWVILVKRYRYTINLSLRKPGVCLMRFKLKGLRTYDRMYEANVIKLGYRYSQATADELHTLVPMRP